METLIDLNRAIHVGVGFVGLAAWWLPVLTKKGGRGHRLFGKVFALCAYFLGLSTFLSVVSRAKPKIADYPFTTLHPNLGVVRFGGLDFVLADIPGLIEGAHEGAGIGDRFLGHVERTAVLLHLVDATANEPLEAYRIVRSEMQSYGAGLDDKPEVLALSKADAVDAAELSEKTLALEAEAGVKPLHVSAVTGQGVPEVLAALARKVEARRESESPASMPSTGQGWQP